MVGDLSLLAVASSSPVVLPPSKDLHGVLPAFQGKRPADAAAAMQLCAPPQHQHHHLDGMPQALQMVVPGHQGTAAAAAYQAAFAMPDKAALVDVQDSHPDSIHLSLGIAEQCARQDKIVKFLMSGCDVKELDKSFLAEFTGQQTLAINLGSQPYIPDDKLSIYEFGLDEPQQYMPETHLVIPDPLVDFALSRGSALTINQDGRVLLNGIELRDLLSFLLQFNMSRREATGCKTSFLVPYFDRLWLCVDCRRVFRCLNSEADIVMPGSKAPKYLRNKQGEGCLSIPFPRSHNVWELSALDTPFLPYRWITT